MLNYCLLDMIFTTLFIYKMHYMDQYECVPSSRHICYFIIYLLNTKFWYVVIYVVLHKGHLFLNLHDNIYTKIWSSSYGPRSHCYYILLNLFIKISLLGAKAHISLSQYLCFLSRNIYDYKDLLFSSKLLSFITYKYIWQDG